MNRRRKRMSTEENKNIVRRYMAEGVNRGDVTIATELFAPDFRFHFPGAPVPLDAMGWSQTTKVFQAGFPGQETTVEDLIAEGEKVAARFTFRGTQTGEFQGI